MLLVLIHIDTLSPQQANRVNAQAIKTQTQQYLHIRLQRIHIVTPYFSWPLILINWLYIEIHKRFTYSIPLSISNLKPSIRVQTLTYIIQNVICQISYKRVRHPFSSHGQQNLAQAHNGYVSGQLSLELNRETAILYIHTFHTAQHSSVQIEN